MATLIKIDRNGSKHFEGMVTCDRCGGNGGSETWKWTGYTCYKCGGTGKVFSKWIERTPEYEAKLAERRRAKYEAMLAKDAEKNKQFEIARRLEEERIAREEALERARKAISKHVGKVGEKITFKGTYEHSAWFDVRDLFGRKETRYVHTFRDVDGNVFVWKTGRGLNDEHRGEPVKLTGIVKDHSVYRDEKQTVLKNCRITWVGGKEGK